ncbi:hypothetical protein, partial [Pseudomonas yamanorum]|uniref:hypothetical protein n=1 Tax=Pseudomonas yamanorum TaxID=515393 RepID=UPI00210BD015
RIGTPAVTTRGFKVTQCLELAGWICDILDNSGLPAIAVVTDTPLSQASQLPHLIGSVL